MTTKISSPKRGIMSWRLLSNLGLWNGLFTLALIGAFHLMFQGCVIGIEKGT
jgi:hypothetical protein